MTTNSGHSGPSRSHNGSSAQNQPTLKDYLIPCKVTHYVNPHQFWVRLTDPQIAQGFDRFVNEFNYDMSFCSGVKTEEVEIEIGQIYAFQMLVGDNYFWFRGRVLSPSDIPSEEPMFNVRAIDVGVTHPIPNSQLYQIPKNKYLNNTPFAIECRLHGIVPTGSDKWTSVAISKAKEFIEDPDHADNMYIIVKQEVKNGNPHPIECNLVAVESVVKSFLEPAKDVYYSLIDLMTGKFGVAKFLENPSPNYVSDSDQLNGVRLCEQ